MDELTPMKPEDVSKILGISTLTLKDWLREGRIKAIKVGREWRIFKKDLEEYLRTLSPNRKFVGKEERTEEYNTCVKLMGKMSLDNASRAYAEATCAKMKSEFEKEYGVEITDASNNPALGHINPKMNKLWKEAQEDLISIPGGDHLEIITKNGRGYALVSHLYSRYGDHLDKKTRDKIDAFCIERDLEVSISCDSWYFPGQTLLIIYTSKDKPLWPKTREK